MTQPRPNTPRPESWPTFEGRPLADPTEPVVDQGLQFDVVTLIDRRQVLKLLGLGSAAVGIAACAPYAATGSPSASAAAAASVDAADCVVIDVGQHE